MVKIWQILLLISLFFSTEIVAQQVWGKDPFKVKSAPEAKQSRINPRKTAVNTVKNQLGDLKTQNAREMEQKLVDKLKLMGVWQSGLITKAMISGKSYEVGQRISSFKIKEIGKKQVVLTGNYGADYILRLKPKSYQRTSILTEREAQ